MNVAVTLKPQEVYDIKSYDTIIDNMISKMTQEVINNSDIPVEEVYFDPIDVWRNLMRSLIDAKFELARAKAKADEICCYNDLKGKKFLYKAKEKYGIVIERLNGAINLFENDNKTLYTTPATYEDMYVSEPDDNIPFIKNFKEEKEETKVSNKIDIEGLDLTLDEEDEDE